MKKATTLLFLLISTLSFGQYGTSSINNIEKLINEQASGEYYLIRDNTIEKFLIKKGKKIEFNNETYKLKSYRFGGVYRIISESHYNRINSNIGKIYNLEHIKIPIDSSYYKKPNKHELKYDSISSIQIKGDKLFYKVYKFSYNYKEDYTFFDFSERVVTRKYKTELVDVDRVNLESQVDYFYVTNAISENNVNYYPMYIEHKERGEFDSLVNSLNEFNEKIVNLLTDSVETAKSLQNALKAIKGKVLQFDYSFSDDGYYNTNVKFNYTNLSNKTIKKVTLKLNGYNIIDEFIGTSKEMTCIGFAEKNDEYISSCNFSYTFSSSKMQPNTTDINSIVILYKDNTTLTIIKANIDKYVISSIGNNINTLYENYNNYLISLQNLLYLYRDIVAEIKQDPIYIKYKK